ncbi:serine/threonine-protein kinase HipA [Gemmobacter caeni]|uniref:Serine/threonine-protein kinase HipA n=1 Tax=Gemmobacter caeni TaxID=589035 RepID=A0A2T6A7R9_9RHOB|nr:type II toxin-antitoxin system HipA family toxin [Gemmobacter caeni]PTX39812.1 serine/threonine-protein kinase HipA [Gemmobacter caeni]TWI93865.1 serine/threonine-protein kinase HipA [Gemmobacter caeni]
MARLARRRAGIRRSKTAVWYERTRVGTLTKATDGGVAFSYDPGWLASDMAFPVASVLPLTQADWKGDPVIAAFDNLLPDAEGELRERIAVRVGAEGKDVFSLLSALGRDCVGALQFLPPDEEPAAQDMDYREISEQEMVADLKNLAAAPLALGDDEDFRISIAGAQEKTAYLRVGGHWAKPRGITPTSHIFKTPMGVLPGPDEIDMSNSVENELFCMTLAREIGLPVANVEKIILPGQVALAVERFDRVWEGKTLRRLPQEDICQSLGFPSARKYQKAGGPGIGQIMELLRESDDPIRDRETFFRAQIFYFLIGASDGHAKNFSLQLGRRGRFRLAPLYDILSVAPVVHAGRLQRKRYRLAMSIGGHYGIDEIVPRHFEAEGKASGLPRNRALELLAEMADRLGLALERTTLALAEQVPKSVSDPITSDSMQRAEQVRKLL